MTDLEKTGMEAAVKGFAHQHIVTGILMKKYQNVSLVNLPLSPYDIVIVLKDANQKETIIRAQVKTASSHVSFVGGVRGGKDRTYKSGIKEYTQSTKTSDVVIGVESKSKSSFDLYFIPTILIEHLGQKSISLKKIAVLKNNYTMLEKSKDVKYVLAQCKKLGLLKK